jgi:hypothetical protein
MTDAAGVSNFDGDADHAWPGAAVADSPVSARDVARVGRIEGGPVRHVALRVDAGRLRSVHRELAQRLTRETGIHVSVVHGSSAQPPLPASVDLLLKLEGMVRLSRGSRLSDRLDVAELSLPQPAAGDPPDLTIDLCGGEPAEHQRTVRVLYDGVASEAALFGALFAGQMPTIEIEDSHTGRVLSRGVPAADNAATILDAYECVLARVVTLLISVVRGWAMLARARRVTTRSPRARDIAAFEARTLAHVAVRRLYHLCCYAPHWRTCWRFVDGPDLWQTGTLSGTSWDVIPDPGFRFYADPFPFIHEGRTFVFVEDLDHHSNKGIISVVPFDERGPSGPAQPVLEEPWHLSYPFVFAHAGQVWMIPESSANRSITLYRADPFPSRWVREATLVADVEASDATIVHHGDSFWMFASTRDGAGSWSDTLSIYSAPEILGPWKAHCANPVLIDQATARPAGAFVKRGGALWRPVQDCSAGYGTGIGLVEVLRLDHSGYEQRLHTLLRADANWPGRRFHTLNRAGRLECIDGAAHSPRNRLLAQRLQGWSGRREPPSG